VFPAPPRTQLPKICQSKDETEKAVHHFEVALGIASSFDWHNESFWIYSSLAVLALDGGRFDDGHAHVDCAMPYAVGYAYNLGSATMLRALLWHKQHRLGEAKSEALRAVETPEKLGVTQDVGGCRTLLRQIQRELNGPVASGQLREFPKLYDFLDFTF